MGGRGNGRVGDGRNIDFSGVLEGLAPKNRGLDRGIGFYRRVLSNRNLIDYPTVRLDECPDRTARPERPFPDGPAAARLY